MLSLYIFTDLTSFVLGIFVALYFGNTALPNPIAFLVTFLLLRTAFYYVLFKKILLRPLPQAKVLLQSFFLLFGTLGSAFLVSLNPIVKIPTFSFYFLLLPTGLVLSSFLTQRFFKVG